ncbi:hypothetical protein J6590_078222 [Homalodisca vitripennis]|nr:hypothetical protein J6590_078222 [Homalodisca vitripennis]
MTTTNGNPVIRKSDNAGYRNSQTSLSLTKYTNKPALNQILRRFIERTVRYSPTRFNMTEEVRELRRTGRGAATTVSPDANENKSLKFHIASGSLFSRVIVVKPNIIL